MIRKIIKFPAPSLRSACKPVDFSTADRGALLSHIRDLKDTLAATPHGVALASNQVLTEGYRVFVVREGLQVPGVKSMMMEKTKDGMMSIPDVFVNPTWEIYNPHEIDTFHPYDFPEHLAFIEGCLSVPEYAAPTNRQYWVDVTAQDEDGNRFVWIGRGFGARIIQHECDHLDGKLVLDYADRKTQFSTRAEAIKNRRKGK